MDNLPGIPSENQPLGGAPLAGGPSPVEQKMRSLGTVALVLGILELCAGGWGLLSQAVMGPLFKMEGKLVALGGPNEGGRVLEETARLMSRTAWWTAAHVVPYLVLSAMLIAIAGGLRKGRLDALAAARRWSLYALGAVAWASAISMFVVVPMTIEHQKLMLEIQHGTARSMQETINGVSSVMMWIGPILGAAFMSAWPIALRVIAGRIQRAAGTATP